jgi:hypothetical protein
MVCKYCGQKVFYFYCDCGCKVFFDDLGGDWPIHNCDEYNNTHKNISKSSNSGILIKVPWIFISADEIEENYKQKIIINKPYLYNSNVHILSIEPKKDKVVTITGIVKEIKNNIDLYKKFKINKESIIGSNLLKKFGNEIYQQITIHVINLDDKNKDCYTAFNKYKYVNNKQIMLNDNVIIKLKGINILDDNVWNCISIEKLDDSL